MPSKFDGKYVDYLDLLLNKVWCHTKSPVQFLSEIKIMPPPQPNNHQSRGPTKGRTKKCVLTGGWSLDRGGATLCFKYFFFFFF